MTLPAEVDVVIVGAGLAGLSCAETLSRARREVCVLESAEAVGGRVRTDQVDGFLLDRGFQVLNTGYPEVSTALDLDALDLCFFDSAVQVARSGGVERLPNPLREPRATGSVITSGLSGTRGKSLLGWYAARATLLPVAVLRRRHDVTGPEAWRAAGLPEQVVQEVLTPFFSGVVLEREITTSRRFLDLMMRMFARGRSAVPAGGMQRMPQQIADRLPAGTVHLGVPARQVRADSVVTDAGTVRAARVVVATDAWTACELVPALGPPPAARGVTTYHHVSDPWPGQSAARVVEAVPGSPIANTVVTSAAAPSYSGDGRALISTSVVHDTGRLPEVTDVELLEHLSRLHGVDASGWELLYRHDVPRALPAMTPPHPLRREQRVAHDGGEVLIAGDHRDTSSIQGALVSGRRAAEAVLAQFTEST